MPRRTERDYADPELKASVLIHFAYESPDLKILPDIPNITTTDLATWSIQRLLNVIRADPAGSALSREYNLEIDKDIKFIKVRTQWTDTNYAQAAFDDDTKVWEVEAAKLHDNAQALWYTNGNLRVMVVMKQRKIERELSRRRDYA